MRLNVSIFRFQNSESKQVAGRTQIHSELMSDTSNVKTIPDLLFSVLCCLLLTSNIIAATYTNPIIYADYSDPDAIRVDNDYYMTASSFNCFPGLQILHSTDLVNWTIVNAALPKSYCKEQDVEHGNLVWAPSLRYHNNRFYIFWGDPDRGIYYISTRDIRSSWSEPQLLIEGKGYIDPCPYWQGDTLYIVHALAGSRAGLKSVLLMATLTVSSKKNERSNHTWLLTDHRIIFDGHRDNPTCEGPKIYFRNGYYYIFTPAGGVATGWQLVLRSNNIYGPYEQRIVLRQGNTTVNGPHQGAWVDTPEGEHWFLHFQDVGALGRIVHLQPMTWQDDWPVIGNNGQPVGKHKVPKNCKGQRLPQDTIINFTHSKLDYSWQYPHSPDSKWHYCDAANGLLRLYSVPMPDHAPNLWNQPNMLLRKIDAPELTITAKVHFQPHEKIMGERAGLLIMGLDYAAIMLEKTDQGVEIYSTQCIKANKGTAETQQDRQAINTEWVYLKVQIADEKAQFAYSTDNKQYISLGDEFILKEGVWIGAKYGFVCTRPPLSSLKTRNDGGNIDIDYLEINYK